ncbi:MAG: phosphotransferase [Pseudonocardiaceae bacterium]|nr:phosphotransferase [Pseudonocardiaceae bacterium]
MSAADGEQRRELAAVRPDEELDWAALEAHLRAELPELAGEFSVLQFPNGAANLTYQVRFGQQHLVVRRPPFGSLAPGAHDMHREYRALSKLWRAYDRAPRALHYCADPDVIGAEFLVVEYRPGVVVWDAIPPGMADTPDAGRRIGLAVVDALVDLHRVDVAAAGLSDLGKPEGFLQRQVAGWRRRWEAVTEPGRNAEMDRLAELLTDTMPESGAPTVLHNDFKIDNCQFAPDDPDRVISVFDWDMATLGDPLVDLGTLLNYWPDPSDDDATGAMAVRGLDQLGLPTRAEVIERYAAGTGRDVAAAGWYEAFGCWKTAVVVQQLYARYLRGETTDERMATRGEQIDGLAWRALVLLGHGATSGP